MFGGLVAAVERLVVGVLVRPAEPVQRLKGY
jgi:hypothetical protein